MIRSATLLLPVRASPLGSILRSSIFRQAGQMILTRGIGLGVAAAGSIWAARCLGPEKLGISGMAIAVVTPLVLLIDQNQNVGLVRIFKSTDTRFEQRRLALAVFLFRLALCLVWCAVAVVALLSATPLAPSWHRSVIAAFPLLLFTSNQASWLLQAQENVPATYWAMLVQSVLGASCYALFFRPNLMPAGADVIVMAVAVCGEFWTGWWLAGRGLWPEGKEFRTDVREALVNLRTVLVRMGKLYWSARWLAISGFVSYLYVFFQIPLVGSLLGTEALGTYRASLTLVNGFQAFALMVPALLYPRLIEWSKLGPAHLWKRQCHIAGIGLLFMIPVAVAALILAPSVYKLLYGPVFLGAAYPFVLLLTAKMVVILNGIFGWGLWAQKRDRLMFFLTCGTAAASIALNFLFIPRYGIWGAALVCLLSETIMLVSAMVASRRLQTAAAPLTSAASSPDQ